MFDDIREEATRKLLELKFWIISIKEDDTYCNINLGLFFVYIYGIYEELIRRVVTRTIEKLNEASVTVDECIYELYAVILAGEYDCLHNVGNSKKWERRWDISNKIKQNNKINISLDIIPTDGKNIRISQLESIAKSFGIKEDILPRSEVGGYIQEMVNNRNYIAHGNKLPKEVGRNYTKVDLLKRCEYISEIITHIITIYECYISDEKYKRTHNN